VTGLVCRSFLKQARSLRITFHNALYIQAVDFRAAVSRCTVAYFRTHAIECQQDIAAYSSQQVVDVEDGTKPAGVGNVGEQDADSFAHFSDEDENDYEEDEASHTNANDAHNDSADGHMQLGYEDNRETGTQHGSVNGHDDDDMRESVGGYDGIMDLGAKRCEKASYDEIT